MFPIDAVYTWVENSNPDFRRECQASWEEYCARRQWNRELNYKTWFTDNGEMMYSLRSLEKYAPWIRKIHIVTNGDFPEWLVEDHPKISRVSHTDIFPENAPLPSFSSMNIEMYLKNIPDLAEHFLSFNDDFMLGAAAAPSMFFTEDGKSKNCFEPTYIGRPIKDSDPNYYKAWTFSNELMNRVFNPACRHVPLHQVRPLLKSVCSAISQQYEKEIQKSSMHPFRYEENVAFPSMMAPWWAVLSGVGVHAHYTSSIIKVSDDFVEVCKAIDTAFDSSVQLICINEGRMKERQIVWKEIHRVLQKHLPKRSPFEKVEITTS